ncbi:uncharacterized protein EI90DRAFT_3061455 [Cantharellus anzutake]|uniref:uncharacterized protein n=1 Tax=Cantharellus anzutake TaxID=1750568 RepID=UPI0019048DA2|nr:uncharacterized protein EI90DRAFT_3061455 [Cantharellus anzutake]KAF8330067.1 hypothetical protein EI90DRAFT_3061455 [Cantharellus anzutake]
MYLPIFVPTLSISGGSTLIWFHLVPSTHAALAQRRADVNHVIFITQCVGESDESPSMFTNLSWCLFSSSPIIHRLPQLQRVLRPIDLGSVNSETPAWLYYVTPNIYDVTLTSWFYIMMIRRERAPAANWHGVT